VEFSKLVIEKMSQNSMTVSSVVGTLQPMLFSLVLGLKNVDIPSLPADSAEEVVDLVPFTIAHMG
jgi:hypothetical protein